MIQNQRVIQDMTVEWVALFCSTDRKENHQDSKK